MDTKGIAKPTTFNSDRNAFRDWSWKFANFVAEKFIDGELALDWARLQDSAVDVSDLQLNVPSCDNAENVSRRIYGSLGGLCTGEALDIVRNTEQRNGFEAWRKLYARHEPQTAGVRLDLVRDLQNSPKQTLATLQQAIERWEKNHYDFVASGGRALGEIFRTEAPRNMCPADLHEHLSLNHDALGNDYAQTRLRIVAYLATKQGKLDQGPKVMGLAALNGKS